MRPVVHWQDPGLPEKDGVKSTVYELDFSRDGKLIVVACANLVLVYDVKDGDLVHRLKGHKADVYSVSFIRDGTRFASGGADNTVIIWSIKGEGVLKYTHNDSIQKVSYNQATDQLVSCTANDFGLWSKEQKSVSKQKVYPRVLSCAWSNDGKSLALGHENGKISLRDNKGTEKNVIERRDPIFCLAWAPPTVLGGSSKSGTQGEVGEVLAVGCWDQTLSFYTADGSPYLKARKLHFYPCSLSYFSDGEYIVIGGSDKRATLCTKEAVRLCTIAEKTEWVWAVKAQPYPVIVGGDNIRGGQKATPIVGVGSYGGAISLLTLNFALVYHLFKDRFAQRANMSDVVVTHLPSDKTMRIKCRDYVKKIAVYHNRLAVHLPDRINIWELTGTLGKSDAPPSPETRTGSSAAALAAARNSGGSRDGSIGARPVDMHYRLRKEKVFSNLPCDILLVTSNHVVIVYNTKVALCTFECGDTRQREREWVFDHNITFATVDGGPPGREVLLIGLEDGQLFKVFIDNPFPVQLVSGSLKGGAVTVASMSANRDRVAVVDKSQQLNIYELTTRHSKSKPLTDLSKKTTNDEKNNSSEASSSSTSDTVGPLGGRGGRRRGNEDRVVIKAAESDGRITMDGVDLETPNERSGRIPNSSDIGGGHFVNGARVVFSEAHVTSVAFSEENCDSVSYSGNGQLSVKVGEFPPYQLRVEGDVISYAANKAYLLQGDRFKPVEDEDDDDDDEGGVVVVSGKDQRSESKNGESKSGEETKAPEKSIFKEKDKSLEKKKAKAALKERDEKILKEGQFLSSAELKSITVPQSLNLQRFMDKTDFKGAHGAACLGVTVADWRRLALAAANGMSLDIAVKAAVKTKDVAFIELVTSISNRRKQKRLVAKNQKTELKASSNNRSKTQLAIDAIEEHAEGVVCNKDSEFLAEILAFEGRYQEAAKMFAKGGQVERATDMFSDLRRWDDAMMFNANSSMAVDVNELLRRQAEWNEEVGDWAAAAEMFVKSGDPLRAVKLLGEKQPPGWPKLLSVLATDLPVAANHNVLLTCARLLSDADEDDLSRSIFERLDAVGELMSLLVKKRKWPEAVALAQDPANAGRFDRSMFEPYAEWLACNGRFDDALAAFRQAGRPDKSFALVEQLTFNAVVERRFKDAAFYYLLLANEVLKPKGSSSSSKEDEVGDVPVVAESKTDEGTNRRGARGRRARGDEGAKNNDTKAQQSNNNNNMDNEPQAVMGGGPNKTEEEWKGPTQEDVVKHCEFIWRSNIYFAYQRVEDLFKPFTASPPDANFQVSLFLINTLAAGPYAGLPPELHPQGASREDGGSESWLPHGVSMSRILQALAKSAVELGAFKLARHAFERLRALLVPEADRDALELAMLTVQSKPIRDDTNLLPVCFLTGQSQPLLNPLGTGDTAGACGHLFLRSMVNYEVLPLVEFVPAQGLSDEEAIELIRTPPPEGGSGRKNWGDDDRHEDGNTDLFHQAINTALSLEEGHDGSESKGGGDGSRERRYIPIVCDAACLLSLKRCDVFCLRPRLELALANDEESLAIKPPPPSSSYSGSAYNRQVCAALGRGVEHCRFFRNMLGSDAPVALSQSAGCFFMEEDLEMALLKEGVCPISRVSAKEMKGYSAL